MGGSGSPVPAGGRARLALPLAALLLVSGAINMLALAAPVYSMQVFDRVLRTGNGETLVLLSLLLAGALAAYALLDMLRGGQAAHFGHLCESLLGARRLRRTAADGAEAGQDSGGWPALRAALAPANLTRLCDAPWIAVFLLALWAIHVSLALMALAAIVLLAGLTVLEQRRGPARLEGRRSERLLAALQATPMLARQGGLAARALHRFGGLRAEEAAAGSGPFAAGQRLRGAATGIRMAAQSGSLGLAAWLVIQDQITSGAIIAATILMGRSLSLAEQGCRAVLTARAALPELRLLRSDAGGLLDSGGAATEGDGEAPLRQGWTALTMDNAVLRDPLAARGRTLRLHASLPLGTAVLVTGPVASGKSAVCEMLAGLRAPDGGSVRLGGATVQAAARTGEGGIAHVPQRPQFLPGPLLWSLAGDEPAVRRAAEEAAQRLGLADHVLLLPQGWHTEIEAGGAPLPEGMARLAALVRALTARPRLLVVDEPCATLDPGTAARVAELIRPRSGSHILVFAAANPATVPLEPAVEIQLLRDRARIEMRSASRLAEPRLRVAAE